MDYQTALKVRILKAAKHLFITKSLDREYDEHYDGLYYGLCASIEISYRSITRQPNTTKDEVCRFFDGNINPSSLGGTPRSLDFPCYWWACNKSGDKQRLAAFDKLITYYENQ